MLKRLLSRPRAVLRISLRPAHWARLESGFHHLLLDMAKDPDAAADSWKDRVQAEARCAFEETKAKLGDSPQTLKAAALVNSAFVVPSRRVKGGRP